MFDRLAVLTPPFCTDHHVGETLRIDTGVHPSPGLDLMLRGLLAKILVVYDPGWPLAFEAHPGDYSHVPHQVWDPERFLRCQYRRIDSKTLRPGCKVWDQPTLLKQVHSLHDHHLPIHRVRHVLSFPFRWGQLGEVDVFIGNDFVDQLP